MGRRTPRTRRTRREFLGLAGLGAGAVVLGGCSLRPSQNGGASTTAPGRTRSGAASRYDLQAAPLNLDLGGSEVSTWGYNGGVPGPEIRIKEGDTLRVVVKNRLPEGTTVHWHGLPITNSMDGVPDVTQKAIESGKEFTYEFEVPFFGTYFYHSHAGLQLDRGLYGPLIVEPKRESLSYDKEFSLMLDDWLDGVGGAPEDEMKKLKSGGSAMGDMDGMSGMNDMKKGMGGMSGIGGEEAPRQWPPDVVYPYYLINGKPAEDPEELKVKRGEKVRIRFINSASASIYRVALAGHRMTVTHADGQPVEPVTVDALRIGMGERYDVLVDADNPGVWQLAAQAEGTEKIGRALFRYRGSTASVPPADYKPSELEKMLLLYGMLKAKAPDDRLSGAPEQVLPVKLSGDEERYIWMINDKAYPEADTISAGGDKHVRFEFTNTGMMPHPMHLHGHFFRVANSTGRGPMKDTVLVDPRQKLTIDWYSDNPGRWAFHCHNEYHMNAGMFRVVKVA